MMRFEKKEACLAADFPTAVSIFIALKLHTYEDALN